MLSKWPIRNKLLIGIVLLLVIVGTLSLSGFHGVYAYRGLVRSLSSRSAELPLVASLSKQVSDLRVTASEIRSLQESASAEPPTETARRQELVGKFQKNLAAVKLALAHYLAQLEGNDDDDSGINDSSSELQTVRQIEKELHDVELASAQADWLGDLSKIKIIGDDLNMLQRLASDLPALLHTRIHDFYLEARTEYKTLIVLTWVATLLAGGLLGLYIRLFYSWIFRPLRVLVNGSRRVAAGDFNHRIALTTNDEMSELADALNDMTARFQAIHDALDRQVKERTKQVVRSEQMASVGFLAAGVAHEINNPLASIAMCAESLEGRIHEVLAESSRSSGEQGEVIQNYLRMIQNEAFRCKGITERLLDFSRMGDMQRHNTDLRELVQGVIDMVSHLGRYQDKHVDLEAGDAVVAPVNAQELKQVVLNLITNGLDSVSPGGRVRINVAKRGARAELTFVDNGCGMTNEVLEHLFEPFFTRRRTGQGIGLGLSITYRIVVDHGGQIEARSDGPGQGSQFRVSLPLDESQQQKESTHRYQAA